MVHAPPDTTRPRLPRFGRRGFLGGSIAATAALSLTTTGHAAPTDQSPTSVASWDFRRGDATDGTGHGHDGDPGAGVSFSPAGARFDGTDDGEITVAYSPDYQPEVAGTIPVGGRWEISLTGVRPASLADDYQAVASGRTGNDGWIIYLTATGSIEFWMKQTDPTTGYAKAIPGVVAEADQSYDILATWDGAEMSIEVSGAAQGKATATVLGRYTPMTDVGPLRFANGGSSGAEFHFDGTIETVEITTMAPSIDTDDAAFFGLWDEEAGDWAVPSRLDFTAADSLAPVERAVKAGDFTAARRSLCDHIVARADQDTLAAAYNGTFRPALVPLFLDRFWTLGTGEIVQDLITVTNATGTVQAEVLDAVTRAVDSGASSVSFFLMARDKQDATAIFASRTATSGQPILALTAEDGTMIELEAAADTYIRAGDDASTTFGDAPELLVHDSGVGPYGSTTSKAYLSFALPDGITTDNPVTAAQLHLTGSTDDADDSQRIVVFQTLEAFDETTRTWATTVQNTFSWQADPGGFDWRGPEGSDVEFGYQLPRFYQAGKMADAWQESGDDAIAEGLLDQMGDFVADADRYGTPYGSGSFPRSLDSAIRVINWVYALERIRRSSVIDPDRLTMVLRALDLSGQYLTTATHPTPNWMQTQKLALAAVAIHFPELVDSTDWRENAADFLSNQLSDVLHPDGGYAEAADGYAYGVAGSQASVQRHFEENGHALGGKEDLHRLVRFLADQTLPGGKSVGYGDSGSEDRRPSLLSHAELFEDDALLHIATDGAEGSPPDHTSVCYPDTRVAVLRDGWTPDAAYLRINADNGAHSHPDNLAVTVQTHGRQLLPELGAFTYSSDPRSNWLRRTTAAQTTVEVDGEAQDLNADGGFDVFATNPAFDLVTGWTEAQPTVRHRRTVLFVRTAPVGSGFWVVSDQLRPDDGDEHTHRQHWHFLPGAEPTVSDRSAVFSGFESGANLLIAPADSPGLSVKLGDGYHSPRFYSVTTNRHAQMTRSGTGPVVFDTLLQPTSDPTVPKSTVSRLQVTGAGGADAAAMAVDFGRGRTASYLVSHIGTGRQLSFGSCSFDGEVAWVEQQTIHRTWLLYGGRTLTIDDTPVVHSSTAFTDLAVRFTQQRGQLRIDGSGLVPSTDPEAAIRIGLAGVGRVTLNGEQVPFIESDGVVLAAAVA